jgi:hypothetical protein
MRWVEGTAMRALSYVTAKVVNRARLSVIRRNLLLETHGAVRTIQVPVRSQLRVRVCVCAVMTPATVHEGRVPRAPPRRERRRNAVGEFALPDATLRMVLSDYVSPPHRYGVTQARNIHAESLGESPTA